MEYYLKRKWLSWYVKSSISKFSWPFILCCLSMVKFMSQCISTILCCVSMVTFMSQCISTILRCVSMVKFMSQCISTCPWCESKIWQHFVILLFYFICLIGTLNRSVMYLLELYLRESRCNLLCCWTLSLFFSTKLSIWPWAVKLCVVHLSVTVQSTTLNSSPSECRKTPNYLKCQINSSI